MAGTDLELLLGIPDYRVEENEQPERLLLALRPEAVILTGGHNTDTTRELLAAIDVPVIEIRSAPRALIGHVVGLSNAGAIELIVAHLAVSGRKRPGFLGATGTTEKRGTERRSGANAAAPRHGLADIVRLDAAAAPISMPDRARAVEQAAETPLDLDALLCVSDSVAFGAIMALQRMGISVPGDIAVTGLGAFEIAPVAIPEITTVDVGAERIGTEAGNLVGALLRSEASHQPIAKKVRIAQRLVP